MHAAAKEMDILSLFGSYQLQGSLSMLCTLEAVLPTPQSVIKLCNFTDIFIIRNFQKWVVREKALAIKIDFDVLFKHTFFGKNFCLK